MASLAVASCLRAVRRSVTSATVASAVRRQQTSGVVCKSVTAAAQTRSFANLGMWNAPVRRQHSTAQHGTAQHSTAQHRQHTERAPHSVHTTNACMYTTKSKSSNCTVDALSPNTQASFFTDTQD